MADDEFEDRPRISLARAYVANQLRKAASGTTGKFKLWQQALGGLVDGTLRVGSRTPVDEIPAWLTLEVLHGGFATGNLAAAGPLQPHELAALAALGPRATSPERTALNLHYFAGDGRAVLDRMLDEGRYQLQVPEEAALMIASWLARKGEWDKSATLIETIAPFFDRVRFYPVPRAEPLDLGPGIYRQTVGEAVKSLRATRSSEDVHRMREAVLVWMPLYDRCVALFLETLEGERPTLQRTAAGGIARGGRGQPVVIGGWPCRNYPAGWAERAEALLADYTRLRAEHTRCKKPDKPKENFARLRGYLAAAARTPGELTGRDVSAIRSIVAAYTARHGAPDSIQRLATRTQQKHLATLPLHEVLARQVAEALDRHPSHTGLAEVGAVLSSVSDRPLPRAVAHKAMRCLQASLETLVKHDVLPSSEAIAGVLPVLTARTRAATVDDVALRRVFEATYVAFRRRRSLLLLNLESQVQFGELPWISHLAAWVGSDEASHQSARDTLRQVTALVIDRFPETILPNKLVQELRVLATSAGLRLPLVDELAADIFMGTFSEPYLRASHAAARVLGGSVYERYYGVPYARLLEADDVSTFAALCSERANALAPDGRGTVLSGMILEQAQVLTTHNLAPLFDALELANRLDLPQLARRTFDWICRQARLTLRDWRAQLHMLKNTAYAWRQLLFYVALLPRAEQDAFVQWSTQRLSQQRPQFRQRFEPVVAGLRAVVAGETFDAHGVHAASGGKRLYGWTVGTHWLLPRSGSLRPRA